MWMLIRLLKLVGATARIIPVVSHQTWQKKLQKHSWIANAVMFRPDGFTQKRFTSIPLMPTFGERVLGGVQSSELSKMIDHQGWSKATRNDALGTYSRLYTFAIG